MSKNELMLFYNGTFSQWYKCNFKVEGVQYNCAEQYMMAEKARLFEDKRAEEIIMSFSDPRDQKAVGKKVQNFDLEKWNAVARDIVYRGNYAKFTQNPSLLSQLLEAKGYFVEASPTDTIWGVGLSMEGPLILNEANWRGTNWLGEVLTKVRDNILNGINHLPKWS